MRHYHMKYILLYNLLILCFTFVYAPIAATDHQTNLEQAFDIVETFDTLQDWQGTVVGHYSSTPADMPKKEDGSASIWKQYYTSDAAAANWIQNHGEGFVWKGSKSLCINGKNLCDQDNPAQTLGYGPNRLTTFFGDGVSGKSGYKEIHIFFMIKFRDGFFLRDLADTEYMRLLDISSGFTKVDYWGAISEHNEVCDDPKYKTFDGVNLTVLEIVGGEVSANSGLFFRDKAYTASLAQGSCYGSSSTTQRYNNANIASLCKENQWAGIEITADIGTVGHTDGALTISVYNDKGEKIGNEPAANQLRLVTFDHYYNKVTIGGNKCFYPSWGNENRFYIDDFIIDNEEIAPKYFELLTGNPIEAPQNLRNVSF